MERWEKWGELRPELFTVPTADWNWHVDSWGGDVESRVRAAIGAGLAGTGFATAEECPQFAQGLVDLWKNRGD